AAVGQSHGAMRADQTEATGAGGYLLRRMGAVGFEEVVIECAAVIRFQPVGDEIAAAGQRHGLEIIDAANAAEAFAIGGAYSVPGGIDLLRRPLAVDAGIVDGEDHLVFVG